MQSRLRNITSVKAAFERSVTSSAGIAYSPHNLLCFGSWFVWVCLSFSQACLCSCLPAVDLLIHVLQTPAETGGI